MEGGNDQEWAIRASHHHSRERKWSRNGKKQVSSNEIHASERAALDKHSDSARHMTLTSQRPPAVGPTLQWQPRQTLSNRFDAIQQIPINIQESRAHKDETKRGEPNSSREHNNSKNQSRPYMPVQVHEPKADVAAERGAMLGQNVKERKNRRSQAKRGGQKAHQSVQLGSETGVHSVSQTPQMLSNAETSNEQDEAGQAKRSSRKHKSSKKKEEDSIAADRRTQSNAETREREEGPVASKKHNQRAKHTADPRDRLDLQTTPPRDSRRPTMQHHINHNGRDDQVNENEHKDRLSKVESKSRGRRYGSTTNASAPVETGVAPERSRSKTKQENSVARVAGQTRGGQKPKGDTTNLGRQSERNHGALESEQPSHSLNRSQLRAHRKDDSNPTPSKSKRRKREFYSEYIGWDEAVAGVKSHEYFYGSMRINAKRRSDAYVTIDGFPIDILIEGDKARNRALEGDLVVIKLNDIQKWVPLEKEREQKETSAINESDAVLLEEEITSDSELDQSDSAEEDDTHAELSFKPESDGAVSSGTFDATKAGDVSRAGEGPSSEKKVGEPLDKLEISLNSLVLSEDGAELISDAKLTDDHTNKAIDPREAQACPADVAVADSFQDEVQVGLWNPKALKRPWAVTTATDQSTNHFVPEQVRARVTTHRPTGTVLCIYEANHAKDSVGTLGPTKTVKEGQRLSGTEEHSIFRPLDKRTPFVLIPRRYLPEDFIHDPNSYANKLMMCRIERWPARSRYPFGTIKRHFGEAGEIATETETLLAANDVNHGDFPKPALQCLKPFLPTEGDSWKVPEKEIRKRLDLRANRIFTIDPTTAKDLDDALHITPLDDDIVEVGVHIADVSFFVRQNTALDKEAFRRCTTVYLVQMVVPMLPALLCEELCSLNPNVDRLAYSVIWKMKRDGTLCDEPPRFTRSVIRSCSKLDYPTAQRMIEGQITKNNADDPNLPSEWWDPQRRPIDARHRCSDIVGDVLLMHEVAKARRALRFQNGALSLSNIKLFFELDEEGNPAGVKQYPIKDSNRLVEEFMLLANYLVAQQLILQAEGRAFLRCHPDPQPRNMEAFLRVADKYGLLVDPSSAGAIGRSLEEISSGHPDPCAGPVMQLLATRTMRPAEYFSAGLQDQSHWQHYALNIPYYTHFTSPIRRYADVIVHRLLTATLSEEKSSCDNFYLTAEKVQDIARRCNEKKRAAKAAGDRSSEVFLCVYLKTTLVEATAIVVGIGEKSFTVFVPEYGCDDRLYMDALGLKSSWNAETETLILYPGNSGCSFESLPIRFLSKLRVKMACSNSCPIQVSYKIIGPA